MLHPAQLYRDELKRKLIEIWYNPKYKWYHMNDYHEFTVPDTHDYRHDFVHLDSSSKVDGFFSYNYSTRDRAMTNFGLVSFSDNGTGLVMDAIHHVKEMLESGEAQRIEFWAFVGNPVSSFYNKLVAHNGGVCCGYLRRCAFFDGEYHDARMYEILAEDYVKCNMNRAGDKACKHLLDC